MNLYLVRHGRSVANEEQLVTGNLLDTLSQQGVLQVQELGKWLSDFNLKSDRYITSQWRRAQQTAEILYPDVSWEIDRNVGETDAGDVVDWKLTDFLDKYPDFYALTSNCYPGGESHDQLNARTVGWLGKLLEACSTDENVLLVSHSGPISCLLQYVTNVSMNKFPAFVPANASLSIISFPENELERAAIKGFSLVPDSMLSSYLGCFS